jgi:hypothetical protein
MISIGASYNQEADFDNAVRWYRAALEIAPNNAQAHYNIGTTFTDRCLYAEAMEWYDKAIALDPNYPPPQWNKANALLTLGRLVEGFEGYEWRFRIGDQNPGVTIPGRRFARPQWNGETKPCRLHVHAEMGHGDSLQFCRYIPMLRAMGHDVRFEVPVELFELFQRSFAGPGVSVQALSPDYPGAMGVLDFDMHLPLMSAPRAFKTDLDTIPWPGPYIKPSEKKVAYWRGRLGGLLPQPNVGICWAGGQRPDPALAAVGARRDMPFEMMMRGVADTGVNLVSLQVGRSAKDAPVYDLTAELKSYDDTAALIQALDLVITVDTSVAHVAGALGKETWLMNRYDTCWRWMLGRDDTPWYPSFRIFRQQAFKEWGPVMDRVKAELTQWAAARRQGIAAHP